MKKFICFFLTLSITVPIYGQFTPIKSTVAVLGDTKKSVMLYQQYELCEVNGNVLLYCNDKDRLAYSFNNRDYLFQITKMVYCETYNQAWMRLKEKLDIAKNDSGIEPLIHEGYYSFYFNEDHSISFNILSLETGYYFAEVEINTEMVD